MHAVLQLDVVIIGAGLAGIATAFRLSQAGHRVRVLDEHDKKERGYSAVHLPPNGSRILADWGLKDELESLGKRIRHSVFCNVDTGEMLGSHVWRESIMRELGSEYYFMHYHDLYTTLYDAAIDAGVHVQFNKRAVDVTTNPPRVTLSDQTVLEADLVIGADRSQSVTRKVMLGGGGAEPKGHTIFTGSVPTRLMKMDALLAHMVESCSREWYCWLGTSRCAESVPIRDGNEIALRFFFPDEEIVNWENDSRDGELWSGSRPRVGDPKLQRLVDHCSEMRAQKLFTYKSPENWIDDSGRLLLIGDAAHTVFPGWTHSCAIHLEDAEVLGTLLSRIGHISQLPALLGGFQDLREPRVKFIREIAWRGTIEKLMLPPGSERDARDAALRRQVENAAEDDGTLRQQFDVAVASFGYNAREVAEDWWATWGSLMERSRGAVCGAPGFMCGVSSFRVVMEEDMVVPASE